MVRRGEMNNRALIERVIGDLDEMIDSRGNEQLEPARTLMREQLHVVIDLQRQIKAMMEIDSIEHEVMLDTDARAEADDQIRRDHGLDEAEDFTDMRHGSIHQYDDDPIQDDDDHDIYPDSYRGPDGVLGNDFPDKGW